MNQEITQCSCCDKITPTVHGAVSVLGDAWLCNSCTSPEITRINKEYPQ